MVTKADRGVLYFERTVVFYMMINLHLKVERPSFLENQNRGHPCSLFRRGSLTVEASFSATAFFLALFSLLYLFQMLFEMNLIQLRLATAVWQYEALGTRMGTVEGMLKEKVLLQWDEEKEICFVERTEKIPYLGGRFFGINLYQQMKTNTYKGRSMFSEYSGTKEYVYVAENGSVYHRSRDCVYLQPEIHSIEYGKVSSQRNNSGGIYRVCKSCSEEVVFTEDMAVYITPYGDRFHVNTACSGLKRTVKKIELSKVGNLPPCSKCAE